MKIPQAYLHGVFAVLALSLCAGEADFKAPLPVDPKIKMGALENGLRYWIREHKTPPGKVGIWMHVGSGSINEDESQRGLAHFLEHMAFNGSANYPPGTLVKYFESIGLRFGQHQNAFTGFDQTTYILSLPDTKDETLGKGLQCLADFAFRMSLLPEEIEKERGVILEEARSRKGAQQRITDKLLPILAPGSRFAERLPIGKEEIIRAADQKVFKDYYTRWYRPDNTTVLIVGDLDAQAAERFVKEQFSAWPATKPTPDADPGIKPYTAARAATLTDPELTTTEVSAVIVTPMKKVDTLGDMRERFVEDLGNWIVNRRLDELKQKGLAPYQGASVSVFPFLNVCTYAGAGAAGKPDQWEPMMRAMLTELKRARDHGFLAQELEDAKKETLSSTEQAARTEVTWDAHAFLGRMNNALAQRRKPMSEAQRLELTRALLSGITLEETAAAFKKNFAAASRLLIVKMPETTGLKCPSEAEILDLAAKVEATAVEALMAKTRPKSLMEKEPASGAVANKEEEPDLKILTVTFENGVRAHFRSMDFKKDQVLVEITLAGGEIRETPANRGVSEAAGQAFGQAATAKLDSTVVRDLMTGKNVQVSGGSGDDAFKLSVRGSPADLEEGLRLAHLLLTEGKLEESALKVWRQEKVQALEQEKTSVEAQLQERMAALLSADDPRALGLKVERVKSIGLQESQRWLDGVLKSAPIEAAFVGDIPMEKALELAQKYLGSLPRRERTDPSLEALRKVEQRKGPLESVVEVETITPRAVVLTGWRGADWKDVKGRRVLQIAAQILSGRLREEIREKRALTYSSACFARPAQAYPGTGIFAAYFTADPEKIAEAAKIARELMERFAKEGPTDAEMDTLRKQLKNQLEVTLKEPSYWAGVLGDLDYHGTKLSDVKEVLDRMLSYTRDDVLAVLKEFVTEDRRIQVIASPKKRPAP